MTRRNVESLMKSFRESRKQSTVTADYKHTNRRTDRNHHEVKDDPYKTFLYKYERLATTIDSFTTRDLLYFFREKAREADVNYVIANFKRDMAIFKKLTLNYSPREICLMIEFIFNSKQDYLNKHTTQPTVLASAWCNTIYHDSLLWAEDKYEPYVKANKNAPREWGSTPDTESIKIDSWDE